MAKQSKVYGMFYDSPYTGVQFGETVDDGILTRQAYPIHDRIAFTPWVKNIVYFTKSGRCFVVKYGRRIYLDDVMRVG